jgi:hypothetical protein
VAWTEYKEHPLVGSGAGTFEQFWQRDRPVGEAARDGHSLYLETLAQLGWPGLLVVLCMLGLPFAAAVAARREPLAAGAFGAYVAYVVHTGVDWDWEMPILTLFALLCAVTLFTARDDRVTARRPIGSSGRAVAITVTTAVAAIGMVGLAGNRPLAQATEAAGRHAHREAEAHARTAARWAPWSAEAQRLLGEARVALGRRREGRANLLDAARSNPHDWQIWYDLGRVETGASRARAFVRAATLNPMQPEIEVLRRQGHRLPRRRAPG